LKEDYNRQTHRADVDKIDDDVKVLLVIHPKDISDKTQYAIDQFIMRGGKLIAFLDPQSWLDSRARQQQNPMMGPNPAAAPPRWTSCSSLGPPVRHRQGGRGPASSKCS
jgi:ABC-type uncharacterized transport system involved in gliding motility auxiliary subunit